MPDAHVIGEHYRIEGLIGQGGMGAVYRGVDTRTQTVVAIKELKPELVKAGGDSVSRFEREAEALRKLNHPNIVKVLASITETERHYIVMEYLNGGSLEDLLQKTPQLPVERVLEIALDLTDALTRAHRLKIIHRDIKPANVLLRDDGSPLLTDFGVARIGNTTRMTAADAVVGTLAYLPPEALRSEAVDERLDIWSFGVMLYEMLAGVHPFAAQNTGALLNNIISQPVPDLFAYRSYIPWTLMGMVYWMVEKDPMDRPSSVRLIGAMLENIMSGTVIPLDWATSKSTPSPDSATYRPNREEAIRAVMEYTTTAFRLDAPKSATPTPTNAATLVDLGIMPPSSNETVSPTVSSVTATAVTLPAGRRPAPWMIGLAAVLGVVALLVLVVLPGLGTPPPPSTTDGAAGQVIGEPPAEGERLALIAQFERISGEERDVSRFIVENLRRNLEDATPYSDVRVRAYSAVIADEDKARRIGEETGAEIVIWGSYDAEGVTAQIQVGSIAQLPTLVISREDLETIVNTRVLLTSERRETLAYNVVAVLNALASWSGDSYGVGRNLLVLQALDETPATVAGNNIAARYHRFIISYIDDTQVSIDEMTEAIRLDANNPMLYTARALAYQRTNEMDKARADTRTAERLIGAEGATWLPVLQLDSLDAFFIRGDYEAAYGYLDQLVAQRPDDWYMVSFRGISSYLQGDYATAEADLERAITLKPQANFPFTFLIALRMRQGDMVGARALFRQVLEEFPDPSFAENLLRVTLSPATAASPLVPLTAAFGNVTLRRWQDVVSNTQPAVDADFPFADPYMLRGMALCNLERYAEAEETYSRALALDESFSLLYLLRAEVRRENGDVLGAGSDLAVALARPELAQMMTLMQSGGQALSCKTFLDLDVESLMTPEATAATE